MAGGSEASCRALCELVIFLVSPEWRASEWCVAEFLLAKNLNKRIVGVIVDPIPLEKLPTEMTAEWQLVDLTAGKRDHKVTVTPPPGNKTETVAFAEDGLERLRIGLMQAGLDARYFAWPPENDPERAPYRGLEPLQAEDAGIFFGRDGPTIVGLDLLRGLREAAPPRLLQVFERVLGLGEDQDFPPQPGCWIEHDRFIKDRLQLTPLRVLPGKLQAQRASFEVGQNRYLRLKFGERLLELVVGELFPGASSSVAQGLQAGHDGTHCVARCDLCRDLRGGLFRQPPVHVFPRSDPCSAGGGRPGERQGDRDRGRRWGHAGCLACAGKGG